MLVLRLAVATGPDPPAGPEGQGLLGREQLVSGTAGRDHAHDRLVASGEREPVLVVLAGLQPELARDLQALVRAAGLECRVRPGTAHAPVSDEPHGSVVVVLPLQRDPSRPPLDTVEANEVVVVAEASTAAYVEGLRTGATGVISPATPGEDAIAVIRGAARGHALLPRAVVRALQSAAGPVVTLSDRERSWLRDLASGARVSDLARAAGLPDRDLYRSLAEVYARLGAATRSEALLVAERAGLLDLAD